MISIVIPVYNVAQYLNECLQSVANQTYTDWECILVDDGSTDGSSEICDEWGRKDYRFVVHHQHNQGVSVARNYALDVVKGEYVCFIDSDDWVEKDYIRDLVKNMEGVELAVSGMIVNWSDGRVKYVALEDYKLDIRVELNKLVKLIKMDLLYGPVNKLYRRDILREKNVRFPSGISYGEDLVFNCIYLKNVHSIFVNKKCNYHYRIGTNTLATKFRANMFDNDYYVWQFQMNTYKSCGIEKNTELSEYMYLRLWGLVYDGLFMAKHLKQRKHYIDHILSIPDIDLDDFQMAKFSCSWWVRYAILHRMSWVFVLNSYRSALA